jgi:hypothetical protein
MADRIADSFLRDPQKIVLRFQRQIVGPDIICRQAALQPAGNVRTFNQHLDCFGQADLIQDERMKAERSAARLG